MNLDHELFALFREAAKLATRYEEPTILREQLKQLVVAPAPQPDSDQRLSTNGAAKSPA